MRVELLDDRVLVSQEKAAETTPGGIVLPDSAKREEQKGVVISVGPGKMLDDGTRVVISVRPGDTVLFPKFAGMPIERDEEQGKGENRLVLREAEIIGVVREGA